VSGLKRQVSYRKGKTMPSIQRQYGQEDTFRLRRKKWADVDVQRVTAGDLD
jgi:hypothetical protein